MLLQQGEGSHNDMPQASCAWVWLEEPVCIVRRLLYGTDRAAGFDSALCAAWQAGHSLCRTLTFCCSPIDEPRNDLLLLVLQFINWDGFMTYFPLCSPGCPVSCMLGCALVVG